MIKMSMKLCLQQFGFVVAIIFFTIGVYGDETSTCLMVYKDGGAPAVFQSPKCRRWNFPSYSFRQSARSSTDNRCQSTMLQGRRKYQEDRLICALDILIPFPGKFGIKEVMVDIVAVFDGHNGAEASEMASKLLLEYFALHTFFLLDASYSFVMKKSMGLLPTTIEGDVVFQVLNWKEELGQHELNSGRFKFSLLENFDDSFHLDILKEALLRAIHDIDATFSKEASKNNIDSGSTATIALIADGKILAANIGDSKALLCSKKYQSNTEARAAFLRSYLEQRRNGLDLSRRKHKKLKLHTDLGRTHFVVEELTKDHHPDRPDERLRVETSGGYVVQWGGVSRVNGQLAVSRAIGDLGYKRYGVVSAPEVTDWRPLATNDSYLVVASDGIFEKLSSQDVCDILWEVDSHGTGRLELVSSHPYSLAESLVNTAFEKGSMDNMAVVVVPLLCSGVSQDLLSGRCLEGVMHCSTMAENDFQCTRSAIDITSNLKYLKNEHSPLAKFDRLLVEGNTNSRSSVFYLSECLRDHVDVSKALRSDHEDHLYDHHQALPKSFDQYSGGHLDLYNGQNMCLNKDQCFSSEGFTSFIGLLESIPFLDPSSANGTEYASPNIRYVLKKKFGRGAYGEVWLAFHWNCHQDYNASRWSRQMRVSNVKIFNSDTDTQDCNASDSNLYILKRIMVERGAAVYLSGLREKYFGELFLNASRHLGGLQSDETVDSFISDFYFGDILKMNKLAYELAYSWSFQNLSSNKFKEDTTFEEGLNHIARYVESFESRSNEIWLVFRHEGVSLSKLMYTVEEVENKTGEEKVEVKHAQLLHPSDWWHWMKTTKAGQEEMRNLIWQLLMGLKSCHDRNITHRDIKPENMVVCLEDQDTGKCLPGIPNGWRNYTTKMRIIDFGSAINDFTMKHLYGSTGPSRAEQTYEYAPPEGFLNVSWYRGSASNNLKYDMWSVGVVMLELILGSPNVFQIGSKTRALLDPHIKGWNEDLKELAYKLRSFMELCILIPGSSMKNLHTVGQTSASPASWRCSEEVFSHYIKTRDPLKIGFPNVLALRLVRKLLTWDPDDRLSVDDALRHPYFQPPPKRDPSALLFWVMMGTIDRRRLRKSEDDKLKILHADGPGLLVTTMWQPAFDPKFS